MILHEYKTIDEKVYQETLDNGLDVFIINKPGYNKKFVTYTTKYGSLDDQFTANGVSHKVPDGIAHFLEHKMFEKEDGDVFNLFSKNGANANAFTSFDRTSYLFSTTEQFYPNLKLLMDMVEQPYFTDETVAREVGIINEEIKMYQDNPGYRLYFETLNAMYQNLPVKIDIAGTLDSISEITKEHLFLCHETFYHPSNMVLIMVGDYNVEEVIGYVKEHQSKREISDEMAIERLLPEEPREVNTRKKVLELDVNETKVMLGFKHHQDLEDPDDRLKRDISMMFALDMLFGEQSEYYYEMLNSRLIDDSFNFSHQEETQFSHVLMTTNTDAPDAFKDRILEIIEEAKHNNTITKERLDNQKREVIGDFLSSLNSPEYIANQYTKYHLDGYDLYQLPEIIEDITLEEVKFHVFDVLNKDYLVECLVKPYE
ncbi:EF-P 5-aminopentanol modification-associated protein YfmH [Corticicoccus populi]|uniref:EF-P 5-aminopentanol modification-associated protein YfmH n=1 Tax=Corticicoccus populi TaxID=1812821 RepID=A0ABW5WT84_9STAP